MSLSERNAHLYMVRRTKDIIEVCIMRKDFAYSVRLKHETIAALEALAKKQKVPMRKMVKSWILQRLEAHQRLEAAQKSAET